MEVSHSNTVSSSCSSVVVSTNHSSPVPSARVGKVTPSLSSAFSTSIPTPASTPAPVQSKAVASSGPAVAAQVPTDVQPKATHPADTAPRPGSAARLETAVLPSRTVPEQVALPSTASSADTSTRPDSFKGEIPAVSSEDEKTPKPETPMEGLALFKKMSAMAAAVARMERLKSRSLSRDEPEEPEVEDRTGAASPYDNVQGSSSADEADDFAMLGTY